MKARKLEYRSGSTTAVGYLAWDEALSGQRPGVIVFPEAFGLNAHAREHAERLAAMGYVALAADFHGEGQVFADLPSVMPAIRTLYADRAEWRARASAALDALVAQAQVDAGRIAAIGFCFGGATCLELARSRAPIKAIATFHAGLVPELPGDAGAIQAKVLMCQGAEDPVLKREAMDAVIAELRRDRVDWQSIHYGNALHSFTDPTADARNMPGFGYNQRAQVRSWALMRQLFDEAFA